MKRQSVLGHFFNKKTKLEPEATTSQAQIVPEHNFDTSQSTSHEIEECNNDNNFPECWSSQQYKYFKEKYDGLLVLNKKIGCQYCAQYGTGTGTAKEKGIHVSKEWQNIEIEASGKNKVVQQASLRKKMNEHFNSKAHKICIENSKLLKENLMPKIIDTMNEKYLTTTCRIFNTVYSLTKRCKPFSDIADEIELQTKNGLDMGVGLHSRKTAVKIVDFIAKDIRQNIFNKIIQKELKVCLIIDEASTISSKPVVILYLRVEDAVTPPNIFIGLVELEKQNAETIFNAVMQCLFANGFSKTYLENNLVGFCSDGASVMLGRKSGVSTLILDQFPNIIIWHCLNHRLQLVLDDCICEIKQINHFKIFIDKIYVIFHQSNKNQIELSNISEQLEIDIIKIGRVLGPRWAACSLRSTLAVWRAYPALHTFFSSNKQYAGMAKRLENKYFLQDLALMIDVLSEISLLSNGLQARNLDILKAENLITRTIRAFQMLENDKGIYEKKVEEVIGSESFQNINFVENLKFPAIPRQKLLQNIVVHMKKRLMECDHLKMSNQIQNNLEFIKIFEPSYWNLSEVLVPWQAGEEQLHSFYKTFKYAVDKNEFRDFVENILKNPENYNTPEGVQKAKNIMKTIAVSSAEAERGFSQMNVICTDKRSRLTVSNISNILTINLTGLPLKDWNSVPVVKKWLRMNHSADDPRIKTNKTTKDDDNLQAIWQYLK